MSRIIYSYDTALIKGVLKKRYKRFLADVIKENEHDVTTVYCPNTGSMLGLAPPEITDPACVLSVSKGTARKYAHTFEMVKNHGSWVGIHSSLANKIVKNALEMGLIEECTGYSSLSTEVSVGESRVDFELRFGEPISDIKTSGKSNSKKRKRKTAAPTLDTCAVENRMLLEVKSVTLAYPSSTDLSSSGDDVSAEECTAEFPDTVSVRASKHAKTLTSHVVAGGRAVILFLIQRDDVTAFTISDLDPSYQEAIREAVGVGVQILPYKCSLCPESGTVTLLGRVPFIYPLSRT